MDVQNVARRALIRALSPLQLQHTHTMPPSLLQLLLAVVATLARGAAGAAAPFDPTTLTSMAQLRPMSDDQLAAVFASGQAIVPSQEPP